MQSAAAIEVYEILSEAFPSVSWALPKHHYDVQLKRHERIARFSLEKLAKIKNEPPPDPQRFPQLPFRLGFAESEKQRTPRRSIEEVLVEQND